MSGALRDPLNDPTDAEIAAAIAAVRLLLRRRDHQSNGNARWTRAARAAVAAPPRPIAWATAERP